MSRLRCYEAISCQGDGQTDRTIGIQVGYACRQNRNWHWYMEPYAPNVHANLSVVVVCQSKCCLVRLKKKSVLSKNAQFSSPLLNRVSFRVVPCIVRWHWLGHTDRQTDLHQTYRQAGRQAGMQTGRETDRQTDGGRTKEHTGLDGRQLESVGCLFSVFLCTEQNQKPIVVIPSKKRRKKSDEIIK